MIILSNRKIPVLGAHTHLLPVASAAWLLEELGLPGQRRWREQRGMETHAVAELEGPQHASGRLGSVSGRILALRNDAVHGPARELCASGC